MSPDCTCIGENDSVLNAARKLAELNVGSMPICGEDNRLKGMLTDRDIVVQTMIELQRQTVVRDTRSAFQNAMQDRFIAEVERLAGRRVTRFLSNSHVGPDLEIELFVLAPAAYTLAQTLAVNQ
jgi:CBS-domain-containing membrane protein